MANSKRLHELTSKSAISSDDLILISDPQGGGSFDEKRYTLDALTFDSATTIETQAGDLSLNPNSNLVVTNGNIRFSSDNQDVELGAAQDFTLNWNGSLATISTSSGDLNLSPNSNLGVKKSSPADTVHVGSGSIRLDSVTASRVVVFDSNKSLSSSSVTKDQLDTVPHAISGRRGMNGLHFDGRDGAFVEAVSDASYDDAFEGGGYLRFIFKPFLSGVDQRHLDKVSKYTIRQRGNNRLSFIYSFSSTNGEWRIVNPTPIGEVLDVVISYNRNSTSNDPRIWVNSNEVSVDELSTPSGTPVSDSGDNLGIGANIADVGQANSVVYHASIGNVTLTQSDVDEMWQSGGTPHRFQGASQVQLINDVSRNSDFTASGTDWNANGASASVSLDATNDELDITGQADADRAELPNNQLTKILKKGKKARIEINVASIDLDGASYWRLSAQGSGGATKFGEVTSTGEQTYEATINIDHTDQLKIELQGTPATQASITISSITYHQVGATFEADLQNADPDVSSEIADLSQNGNNITYNQNSGISRVRKVPQLLAGDIYTQSSGTMSGLVIAPEIDQSSTAGYTGIKVNIIETNTGSGTKSSLLIQKGGNNQFRFTNNGNLEIKNTDSAPSSISDGIVLYAEDVSTSSELKVIDEAGNRTTLSPHSFKLTEKSEDMAWSYYSENDKLGKRINVDMLKLARKIEELTGEKLVYIDNL